MTSAAAANAARLPGVLEVGLLLRRTVPPIAEPLRSRRCGHDRAVDPMPILEVNRSLAPLGDRATRIDRRCRVRARVIVSCACEVRGRCSDRSSRREAGDHSGIRRSGLSSHAASGLADAGDALSERPEGRAPWESGGLSTTKAQCVLAVATDTSKESWCELAREASATQLSKIASAYRRSQRADAEVDARQEANREGRRRP
jgi:hypothetical protein